MNRVWSRLAPLTGVASVACLVLGTMMVLSQPQDKDSDAKILAYFAVHSHRVKGMIGFFVFLAGILFLLGFLGALRARLIAAEGQHGGVTALAFGAGLVSVGLTTGSMVLANGALLSATNTSKFKLDPNTFRLFADTAYAVWVAGVMIAAIVVWGVSAVALRTGVLPVWWARLGVLVGIVQLAAFLFFPFFAWLLWIIGTSLILSGRRDAAAARVAQPAT
jgi:hypothetical protein